MNNQEHFSESGGRYPAAQNEERISVRPLLQVLWAYQKTILVALAAAMGLFLIGALVFYALQPAERQASLEFRLIFEGADRGEYPNGLRFSTSEIIASPVLTQVYEANDLKRYCAFQDFKNALFVLESSKELELLALEYDAKLSDAKLTPADRARIEAEFRQKRDALRVAQYKLTFMSPAKGADIPSALMSKVLNDILAVWAEHTAQRKRALSYQVDVFTANIISRELVETDDHLIRLDILRGKIDRIIGSLDALLVLPGARVIRVGDARVSLPEVRANLKDVQDFRLEPLLGFLRVNPISPDFSVLVRYLENRLFQAQQDLTEAQGKVTALQDGLRAYTQGGAAPSLQPQPGPGGEPQASPPFSGPTLIPQIGESFLDRLIAMSTEHGDAVYRQRITDEIIKASQEKVAVEKERQYYEVLLRSVQGLGASARGAAASNAETVTMAETRFKEINAAVLRAVEQTNAIYQEISTRNLNPRTNLYSIAGPFSISTQRSFELSELTFYGFLALVLSLILIPAACLAHHYFRSEIAPAAPPAARPRETLRDEPIEPGVGV